MALGVGKLNELASHNQNGLNVLAYRQLAPKTWTSRLVGLARTLGVGITAVCTMTDVDAWAPYPREKSANCLQVAM